MTNSRRLALFALILGPLLFWGTAALLMRVGDDGPIRTLQGPERTTKAMVWRARAGASTLYLCGSIHLLRKSDYPLPAPYREAFQEAAVVIMESPPGRAGTPESKAEIEALSRYERGQTLDTNIQPATWRAIEDWAGGAGFNLSLIRPLKPWMAALTIGVTVHERFGFSVGQGMERHFAARLGPRTALGLEEPAQQLAVFNSFSPALQESLILQTLADASAGPARVEAMAAAWHEGDAPALAALLAQSFDKFPEVHTKLITERNAAWVPKIMDQWAKPQVTTVLVGAAHLVGIDNLVSLLSAKGLTFEQIEYKTTRPQL
jgi:uncharacterized protein